MENWWIIFVCNMITPLLMIGGGVLMGSNAVGNINALCGYRTARSMRNEDTWQFAQAYCGRLWKKIGLMMLIFSALVQLPFMNSREEALGTLTLVLCALQLIVLIGSVFPVEAALKRTFTDDGKRR